MAGADRSLRLSRRRGRARSAGCLVLLLALAAAGCDREASPYFGSTRRVSGDPATLYVNNGNEPEYLDPGKCADGGCAALVVQLFEGLTRHHPGDGHPVQGVARSWEKSDDNRVYRFHLRPDARWSDGRPVTAGVFAYAWKRELSPKTASRRGEQPGHRPQRGGLPALGQAEGRPRGGGGPGPMPRGGRQVGLPGRLMAGHARRRRSSTCRGHGRSSGAATALRFVAPKRRRFPSSILPSPQGWVPDALLDPADGRLVGVRATDDLTLEVELERPTPYFLDLTAHHAYLPVRRDVIEAPSPRRGEEDLWTRPGSLVSNGPYMLDRWAFQYEITMKDNPFHWEREHLKIRRIVWLEVQDYHAGMNLYKAGDLDCCSATTCRRPRSTSRCSRGRSDQRSATTRSRSTG